MLVPGNVFFRKVKCLWSRQHSTQPTLLANIELGIKNYFDKHSSFFCLSINDKEKKCYKFFTWGSGKTWGLLGRTRQTSGPRAHWARQSRQRRWWHLPENQYKCRCFKSIGGSTLAHLPSNIRLWWKWFILPNMLAYLLALFAKEQHVFELLNNREGATKKYITFLQQFNNI